MSDEELSVKQSKAPLYTSLGIVLGIVLAYFFIPAVQDFLKNTWDVFTSGDGSRAQVWVDQFGFWGPLIVVIAMVLQMFLIVIPSPLLMVMTIMAYGPIWGSIILLVAVFTASSVGYLVGKYFGPFIADKLIGGKTHKKLTGFIDDYGFWTVIIIKLCPFLSNDAISFVAGILKMGYWRFIGASLLGSLPLIVFIAYLKKNYESMGAGLLWASIVSIVLFVAFIWWDKKVRKDKP